MNLCFVFYKGKKFNLAKNKFFVEKIVKKNGQKNFLKKTSLDIKIQKSSKCYFPYLLKNNFFSKIGIHSPSRHVRTRLYFTSESHIYSLLTVLKFGKLFEENQDEQWHSALNYLNTVPELNYLTQIVIMLYEDPSVDADSEKRFHVEIHFSPGSYADFDAPKYLLKNPDSKEEINLSEDATNSSTSDIVSVSPKQRHSASRLDKRSPVSNVTKKFPIRLYNKELQTLHEPTEQSSSLTYDRDSAGENNSQLAEPKPRSFEDDQHRNRIHHVIKCRPKSKEAYNHYNTFHGSGAHNYNYLSLNQVFKSKFVNYGTNSSPDLNQNVPRNKKSLPSKSNFIKKKISWLILI